MSECTATGCGAGLADGIHLCEGDTLTLEYRLAEVNGVWGTLTTTLARLDRAASSPGGGGNHAGSREPLNLDALDKAQAFRIFLRSWARRLNGTAPTGEPHILAAWIMLPTQLRQITGWTDAGAMLDDLTGWLNKLRSATDRAAHKITLGDCGGSIADLDCPGTLKALEHATWGRCDTCGQEFDVKDQQTWLISEAWHVAAPLPLILRALKDSGHANIPLERAKKWVQRGKLTPDADGCHTPAAVYHHYQTTTAGKRAA